MKSLHGWYAGLNIYFKLTPFLLLYLFICILFPKDELVGDQIRYLSFANNILNGYYSPPPPGINLWNGPGYPAFLVPFIFFNLPHSLLLILNAFLLYFSLIISYKTFCFYSPEKSSFLYTVLLGFYFPMYEMLRHLLSECLTWFLISLICYSFANSFRQKTISWKDVVLAGFSIAYLAMTKVIFGYVIILMLFVSGFLFLFPAFYASAKKAALIFLVSFLFCLPWLFYTYSLTGKLLYWSNSGGMSLYTMSTPYEGETGQWYDQKRLVNSPNHTVFMDSVLKLTPVQRDEAFKKAAIKNIKNHPVKYLANLVSNVGRLLFFPTDYVSNSILSYYPFIPNMFIVVFIVITSVISACQFKRIPQEIVFLFLFIIIYLAGSTLLSAYRRMFHITMPFWFFFFSYVFNNIISVQIIQTGESPQDM
jgi:hypothetical protein